MLKHLKGNVFDADNSIWGTAGTCLVGDWQMHFLETGALHFNSVRFAGQGQRDPVLLTWKVFNRKLPNLGDPIVIVFKRDAVLFASGLVCQAGSTTLMDRLQPVLQLDLLSRC
ncbi:MAG TPA: hypothetical protein DCP64_13275 [Sarcina sp.]|nr:hypothetical protein [Sarcina sp.]